MAFAHAHVPHPHAAAVVPWTRTHPLVSFVAMLAIAAAIALGAILVIGGDDSTAPASSAAPPAAANLQDTGLGSGVDGHPEEGQAGQSSTAAPAAVRFDGGPEEGSAGH